MQTVKLNLAGAAGSFVIEIVVDDLMATVVEDCLFGGGVV